MIEGLVPYPEYRDSGLPWLPKIPASWSVARNGRLFTQRNKTGHSDLPILEVSLRSGVRVRDMKDGGRKQVMADRSKYKQARAGDLAYNTMRMWQGAVGVVPVDGLVSPAYVVARPVPDVDADYLARLFRTKEYLREIDTFSRGIVKDRNRLYWEAFKQIPTPVPPKEEQVAIVRFLAHADRQVRRAIYTKWEVIGRLEEHRQFIIHRAVTRGLDPDTRLQSSGVKHLGDVPESWRVVSLRHLSTRFGSGVTPRGGATAYLDEGVPFLRSQNVHFEGLRLAGVARIAPELHRTLAGTHVRPGDVLLNITGASLGRVCAVPDDFTGGNVNQHVCIIRPRRQRLLPNFLAAFLSTPFMQREIRFEQNGASREGLTLDSIKGFKVLLPSVAEQQRIISAVHEQTCHLVAATQRARTEIGFLREYLTRLNTDVVVGALDVRAAAAHLPTLAFAQEVSVAVSDDEDVLDAVEQVSEAEEVSA